MEGFVISCIKSYIVFLLELLGGRGVGGVRLGSLGPIARGEGKGCCSFQRKIFAHL